MCKGSYKKTMKRLALPSFFLAVALFLIGEIPPAIWAADSPYPDRPINMVVPYAAGGGADLGSKFLGNIISEFLGQPLISVYKPGGGAALGTMFVAKAKPDGYTILCSTPNPLFLQAALKKINYSLDDFIFVGIYGKVPIWLAVKSDARWKNIREFAKEEKKSPGTLKVATYGKLTSADLVLELFNKAAGIKLTHIPYKSSGEALTAVLGGHVDAAMATGAGGLLESGAVRILAVAEQKRLEGLPDVPTFAEFGYPVQLITRYSFVFPKGTPKEIVDKFVKAQESAVKKYPKEIQEGLRRVEIWADFHSPEESIKIFKEDQKIVTKATLEIWGGK